MVGYLLLRDPKLNVLPIQWRRPVRLDTGIVQSEIDRVRREHGNEAIFGGSYGWGSAGRFHHAQNQLHRLLNCSDGYAASLGSYSTGCAQAIMPHVFGKDFLTLLYEHQNGWQTIHEQTETPAMFGGVNERC
jgi:biotin/methionine sulfoxide reductase